VLNSTKFDAYNEEHQVLQN